MISKRIASFNRFQANREIAQRMARLTGLSPEYVLSANLRVSSRRFWREFLRDQRLTVGPLGSRYLGVNYDAASETPDYDPAMADRDGLFGNVVNLYLCQEDLEGANQDLRELIQWCSEAEAGYPREVR